jgi:lycopene beta-cyclase
MSAVLLAGGGLANCLIAWRLHALRPDVPVILLEQGPALGGNHTWSFHESDVTPAQLSWLRPLIAHSWPRQLVRFPAYERSLLTPYHSLTSTRLHEMLSAALGTRVRLGTTITDVQPDGVRLASGEILAAALVIDGRGAGLLRGFDLRWQKFLGLEVSLARPHGIEAPVLMDATVAQRDGYRFIYVLPLAPGRLLIEDTCYSDAPELRADELRQRVRDYAAGQDWAIEAVLREETGVLPIVLDGDPRPFWREAGVEVPRSGVRAMLFHHTTGYSLPDAVRLADAIASAPELASAPLAAAIRDLSLRRWREQRFFRLLNRLMFEAAEPAERYRTLQHFYRLPEPVIGRFYAGRLRPLDPLRLLRGRPPVPVGRALRCLARSLASDSRGGHGIAQGKRT